MEIGIQINSYCNRACGHCAINCKPTDGTMAFEDLEKILDDANVYLNDQYELPWFKGDQPHIIDITGGEILLYQDGERNLGDVADAIINRGMDISFVTRGWTNAEQNGNKLAYQNFQRIKDKALSVKISYDAQTFNGNRNLSREMLRNSLEGFNYVKHLDIQCAVTPYTFEANFNDVIDCVTELGYNVPKISMDEIKMFLNRGKGKKFEIIKNSNVNVVFFPIVSSGRALGMEVYKTYKTKCPTTDVQSNIVVRSDLEISPCCSFSYNRLPSMGSIRDLTFKEIEGNEKYFDAIRTMQDDLKRERPEGDYNICLECPSRLPTYLK
jgi:hypothetical protein